MSNSKQLVFVPNAPFADETTAFILSQWVLRVPVFLVSVPVAHVVSNRVLDTFFCEPLSQKTGFSFGQEFLTGIHEHS